MKVELKIDENGVCKYFKINGKKYGEGIYELNISIKPGELPTIIMKAKSNEFIMSSENTKLYLDKIDKE